MGCRDRTSNFNNNFYHEGKWWCKSGWDYTYTAPELHLIKARLGVNLDKYVLAFDGDKQQWVATPLETPIND